MNWEKRGRFFVAREPTPQTVFVGALADAGADHLRDLPLKKKAFRRKAERFNVADTLQLIGKPQFTPLLDTAAKMLQSFHALGLLDENDTDEEGKCSIS